MSDSVVKGSSTFCIPLIAMAIAILTAPFTEGQSTNTFPVSGNVGIGTTSPGYLLDVNGNMGVHAGYDFNIGSGLSHSAYVTAIWNDNNNTGIVLHSFSGAVDIPALTINPNGSVGASSTVSFGNLGHPSYIAPVWNDNNNTGLAIHYFNASTDIVGILLQQQTGYVGIGTTTPGASLEVNGNVKLTANSGASITFADGSTQSTAYTGVSCGGDFAESVDVSGERKRYEAGDVLVIDTAHPGDVRKSTSRYSTAVLGIYSTKPGYVGRRQGASQSTDEVPMAMVGIVPTKVSAENGPIRPGDLLVTASIPGFAMKGTNRSRMLGAVIGKALGNLRTGTGVIEVGVTLQ